MDNIRPQKDMHVQIKQSTSANLGDNSSISRSPYTSLSSFCTSWCFRQIRANTSTRPSKFGLILDMSTYSRCTRAMKGEALHDTLSLLSFTLQKKTRMKKNCLLLEACRVPPAANFHTIAKPPRHKQARKSATLFIEITEAPASCTSSSWMCTATTHQAKPRFCTVVLWKVLEKHEHFRAHRPLSSTLVQWNLLWCRSENSPGSAGLIIARLSDHGYEHGSMERTTDNHILQKYTRQKWMPNNCNPLYLVLCIYLIDETSLFIRASSIVLLRILTSQGSFLHNKTVETSQEFSWADKRIAHSALTPADKKCSKTLNTGHGW